VLRIPNASNLHCRGESGELSLRGNYLAAGIFLGYPVLSPRRYFVAGDCMLTLSLLLDAGSVKFSAMTPAPDGIHSAFEILREDRRGVVSNLYDRTARTLWS
jgi:hypothetical protein